MRLHLAMAYARLRARPGRSALSALGIAAVAVMVGASATVAWSLDTGFDRAAARAGLPDVMASFDPTAAATVRGRARALPGLAAVSYRLVQAGVPVANLTPLRTGGRVTQFNRHAVVEGVLPGRRGYAVVAGRDLSGRSGEVVVEQGLARAWHLRLGDRLDVRGFGHPVGPDDFDVVGIAVAPDTVAYPLASGPRLYIPYADARRLYFQIGPPPVNQALLWLRDPASLPLTLEQARLATAGIGGFQFTTRATAHVLIDRAAGIVIALLVAFSVVAVASAAAMLSAAAHADVQRRLASLGVLRAIGGSPHQIVAGAAVEAAAVAVVPAMLGTALGWALARGPTGDLLAALNELPPGGDLAVLLVACVAAEVAVVAVSAALPAWRAVRRRPSALLRAGELAPQARGRWLPAGAFGLGVRFALARPLRTAATVTVVAASAGVVLLMLALAGLLDGLQHDPGTVGRRYALTVPAGPEALAAIRRTPGVANAAPRIVVDAVDSFSLGESFQLVAYPGDPTVFEDPPLTAGRWLRGPGEADVGLGLAAALNLHVGSTLAAELPTGREARFRVVGLVASLVNDGRLAFVRPPRLLAADPGAGGPVAVDVASGASAAAVRAAIARLGLSASSTGGVTAHSAGFLAVLASLLRTVAAVDGLVCLYAVVQMLSLTAIERRAAVATLRALGAARGQLVQVFLGAAAVVVVLAAPLAVAVERGVLGPRTAALAAGYAQLSLVAGRGPVAVLAVGLVVVAVTSAAWVARSQLRAPAAAGLRAE